VPVRRWQRVQWQYPAMTGGAVISQRAFPQKQPPVITDASRSSRE